MANSLIQIVVVLLVIGLILFFSSPYLPPMIFNLIIGVTVIGCLIYALRAAGIWNGPGTP